MLKRVSSIVLTIMMLISMLCTITVASAAPAPQLVLTVDDTDGRVERGQAVKVTVGLSAAMEMNGVTVKLPFNKNLFADAYAVVALGGGTVFDNVEDGKVYITWAAAANTATSSLFDISFTVKSDAAFGFYDLMGAIEEMYHGGVGNNQQIPYVAGQDYTKDAAPLAIEVYCDHTKSYTKPAGTPAQSDAKHSVSCSKCGEIFADEACVFGAPVEVEKEDCTKDGVSKIECKYCKYSIESKIDNIAGHKWSTKWYQDTTAGSTKHYRICENGCGEKDFAECGSWEWNNVSTKDGSKHICTTCKREMACVWHQYPTKTPATCTTDAYTVYRCTVDGCAGNYKVVEAGTATGHTLKKNDDGTHSCANCTEIKNVPCTFSKTVQEGDCVTDTIKACVCGNTKVTEKATGKHPEKEIVIQYKAPTVGASGFIKYYCNECSSEWDSKRLTRGRQFDDINDWYHDMAVFAKSFNLMGGVGEGIFDGDGELTRGTVVTVLGRYLWENNAVEKMSETEFKALLKELGGETVEFKDLKGGWYDRYAIALSAIGVVKGSYGNFNGDDNVTREELATFFIRFIDYIEPGSTKTYGSSFKLSDMNTVSDWAKQTAERAVKTGLIAGSDGKFDPQGTATRAQMATIMERVVRAHSKYPIVNVE